MMHTEEQFVHYNEKEIPNIKKRIWFWGMNQDSSNFNMPILSLFLISFFFYN